MKIQGKRYNYVIDDKDQVAIHSANDDSLVVVVPLDDLYEIVGTLVKSHAFQQIDQRTAKQALGL